MISLPRPKVLNFKIISKILMGMVERNKGNIFVNGMNYNKRSDEIRSIIGYVSQENIFDKELNILENLYFYGQLKGMSKGSKLRSSEIPKLDATELRRYIGESGPKQRENLWNTKSMCVLQQVKLLRIFAFEITMFFTFNIKW